MENNNLKIVEEVSGSSVVARGSVLESGLTKGKIFGALAIGLALGCLGTIGYQKFVQGKDGDINLQEGNESRAD